MADDKTKKKIDLKARLNKTTLTGMTSPAALPIPGPGPSGSGLPPPDSGPGMGMGMGVGATPSSAPGAAGTPVPVPTPSVRPPMPMPMNMGIAPPPGILPPFAPQSRPAAPKEAKATAAQQTIKVEIGEEIHEERKKAKRNAALAALAGAIVGGVLGWVAGGSSEKGGRLTDAARGAGLLEQDLLATSEKMAKLDQTLNEAKVQLGNNTFPDGLATALGAINIPFDTSNLDGKNVGSLSGKMLHSLLAFTSEVEALKLDEESLKNSLPAAQPLLTKIWKEAKEPMANFAVFFSGGDKKVVAELAEIKDPFLFKGEYPATFTVKRLDGGKPADKKVTRWIKGDLTGTDTMAIPIEVKSTTGLDSDQLSKAGLADDQPTKTVALMFDRINKSLHGDPENPTNPKPGLLKACDDLAVDLHKICSASNVCAPKVAPKP
ncbi:MAG: formin [Byssovorax sp.]